MTISLPFQYRISIFIITILIYIYGMFIEESTPLFSVLWVTFTVISAVLMVLDEPGDPTVSGSIVSREVAKAFEPKGVTIAKYILLAIILIPIIAGWISFYFYS